MACKDLGTVISGAERIPRDSGTSDNTGLSGLCHPRVFTNDLLFGALPWLNPPLVRPHGDRLISDGVLTFAWGLQQSPTETCFCCKEAWERAIERLLAIIVGQG